MNVSDSRISRYRFPAEWEPHEATWLVWPQNASDWPGKFSNIKWVYCEIAKHLSDSETVRIIVGSEKTGKLAKTALRKSGVNLRNVEFYECATDRSWIRDFGPFFSWEDGGELKALNFGFNGWSRYPDWENDNSVSSFMAKSLGLRATLPVFAGKRIILEGGSVDTNGKGSLITTAQCLLGKGIRERNRFFEKTDYEKIFFEYLGANNILWLERGIEGDDTNGHTDDICRFTDPETIVLCAERNPKDPNYSALRENMEILKDFRLEDGRKVEIVPLPMPSPVFFDGERLPASYANFYISNEKVLVPTYNDPKDREALGIFSELFPGRKTVGINCVDLAWGLGAIHCATKEQPALRL